jgi:hypothetical protein
MCILEMWRRGEVQTFNDWGPMARAEGKKARDQARAFLGLGAAAPVSQAAAIAAAPIPLKPVAAVAAAPAKEPRKCSACRQPGHTKKNCKGAAAGGGAAAAAPPEPEPEVEYTWEKLPDGTKLPPGRYYLSDTCYALPEPDYQEVWGKKFNFNGGIYRRNDGAIFATYLTAYGDGCYRGSNGHNYGVDAGVIGITSERLMGDHKPYGGTWHEFTKPFTFVEKGGVFELNSFEGYVRINTAGDEEEDEEGEGEDY